MGDDQISLYYLDVNGYIYLCNVTLVKIIQFV